VKTFAIIAIAGFVIFMITAIYLLAGGERPHAVEPPAETSSPNRISAPAAAGACRCLARRRMVPGEDLRT